MEINKGNCLAKFCREKIYSSSDLRKAAMAKRQELSKQGIVNFEENPEYKELTQCKGNIEGDFLDEIGCVRMNNTGKVKTPVNPYANNPNYKRKRCPKGFKMNPFPPFNCIPKKQATARPKSTKQRTSKTRSAKAKSKSARSKPPSAKATPKRCPKGFNRSKKTGNCEAKI